MDNSGRLEKLEEEVKRLSQQVQDQGKTIASLQQRIRTTSQKQPPALFSLLDIPALPSVTLENLIGLRVIHLIGILVLVTGLSLGVKYAIDANLISENMRILLAYCAGGLLLFFSFRLQKSLPGFSAILFSGAMASVYFTTYAALVYYSMLSFTVTFGLMVLFTIFTVYKAIRYNRQEIALLGLVGAYGIPFLISPNSGNVALLFLYMSIINAGIVVLSIKKDWVLMGRLAQAITWVIFIGWQVTQAQAARQDTGLLFMCLFFFQFMLHAVSPKLFRQQPLNMVHSVLVLTNNLALSIAALYVFGSFRNSSLALVALCLSLFMAAQAFMFNGWKEFEIQKRLAYYALVLFVLFIGAQWEGIVVTLLWLLTSVVLFGLGIKQKSNPLRMAGITLMGVTLLKLIVLDSLTFSTVQKVIAYLVLGVLLLLVSFFYQKFKNQLFEE